MTWDRDTAARTIWQEARGESVEGQKAVAAVILNRLRDGRWGNTLASVCLWPAQFSGWHNVKDPNFKAGCAIADSDPQLIKLHNVLDVASVEADQTNGATHYHAIYIDTPAWARDATFTVQIGKHRFYKDVR